MHKIQLGQSDLQVTPICLGTMTFGEQVSENQAHAILDHALERGITFWDTAEMYAVPARAATYGATESILGRWFAKHPGMREKIVLASKVAGPSRGMPWIREGQGLSAADAQLEQNLQVWGTQLPAALLAEINQLRWELRDPAQ